MNIHHIALRVADPARARTFYEGVLGLELVRTHEDEHGLRSVWFRVGTAIVMLERELRISPVRAGSGHVLAFAVDDLRVWRERLASHGVEIETATEYTLYVRDLDGHGVAMSVYDSAR